MKVRNFIKTVTISILAEIAAVCLVRSDIISLDAFMVSSAFPLLGLFVAGWRGIGRVSECESEADGK